MKNDKSFTLYDFKKVAQKTAAPNSPLFKIQERIAKFLQINLSRTLKTPVFIKVAEQHQSDVQTWHETDDQDMALFILSNKNKSAVIAVEIPSALVGCYITTVSGGNVSEASSPSMPLSPINEKIAAHFCEPFISEINRAWETLTQLNLDSGKYVSCRQFVTALRPNDSLLTFTFKCDIDKIHTEFRIALPSSFTRQFKDQWHKVGYEPSESKNLWIKDLTTNLGSSKLNVSVRLGEAEITVDELLKLQPGDIVMLDQKQNAPVKVLVEGIHKFNAQPGVSAGHRAVKIK